MTNNAGLPLITVAICTFNRASSLRRTLCSLRAMAVPDDLAWELVVVNNNCTDETDRVLEAFAGLLPLRREFEPRQGLSHARNRVLEAARGDYIVWTDDDVIVDREWVSAYAEAFRRWPDAAIFGGPVIAQYEQPVAEWVTECEALVRGAYGVCDLGDAAFPLSLDGRRIPFGPSYAVRTAVQRQFEYNPDLGLSPGRNRRGEEVDAIERIMRSGATGYWIPGARVQHCIWHERQTISYIARFCEGQGETSAFVQDMTAGTPKWFGAPRWLWRQLVTQWLQYRFYRFVSRPSKWLGKFMDYSQTKGSMRYCRDQSKRSSQRATIERSLVR